jgi:Zn-finger nucleic acid-binding protein
MYINGNKCPHCNVILTRAVVESIDIDTAVIFADTTYKGVTYACPSCRAVLGISMDQIALNADVVTRLLRALGRG